MTRAGAARRRVLWITVILVAVVGVITTALSAIGFGFTPSNGADANSGDRSATTATATVTRQKLVEESSATGELGFGDDTVIASRAAGTLTALPTPGAVIERGGQLYRVDDLPVVLLYGPIPAYRDLTPGSTGTDVKQFEQNLFDLGYRGFTVDEAYSSATTRAVKAWQKALGLPRTGVVELGRVVYSEASIRVKANEVAVGAVLNPGADVLDITGVRHSVSLELGVEDSRFAVVGAVVKIQLPSGKSIPGKVASTKTVIIPADSNSPGSSATTKLEVTVVAGDEAAIAGFDMATVDVDFTAAQQNEVLSVPVAALLALAEGGYGLQLVQGKSTTMVAVTIGMFAGGRVEVSGSDIAEGDKVGVPE